MLSQTALLKAIKYCDSNQRKLAELIGEDPDKISYWLNRAKQIPFHQAIAIEIATQGLVSRYDLAPYARVKRRRGINHTPAPVESAPLTLSQRGYIGIEMEKRLGNRRISHRRNCAPAKGKTSALAAKEAGFSSRDSYLRVKKVLQKGIPELIQAIDDRKVSIAQAAAIAEFTHEEQAALLQKTRKEITVALHQQQMNFFLKPANNNQENILMARIRTVKPELFRHEELFEAEKKYQLPLRIAFVGLFTCCDREGRFRWKPKQLKLDVLPYDDISMADVLTALTDSGFIVHYEVNGEEYGCIPSWSKHQYLNHREAASVLPGMGSTAEARVADTHQTLPGIAVGKGIEIGIEKEMEREREVESNVLSVFAHWKSVMQHPEALLDKKREQIIQQALRSGYTVAQLCEAITGCSKTPHNMGDNEQGQRYDGIHIILRDADQIERFITNFHNPPMPANSVDKLMKNNMTASQQWLSKKLMENNDGPA